MKYRQCFAGWFVKCLVAVAFAGFVASTSASSVHQGWAKVRYVVGHPEFSKAGGPWQPLEKFMVLHPGDAIRCDGNSHADLMLGYNNGSLQVSPNSELVLDKLTYQFTGLEVMHDTQLNLKSGVLYGHVNKMASGSKYEVKTPRGIAGIRGTRYRISADGDVTVTEGTVIVSVVAPDGSIKTYTVGAGSTFDFSTGDVRPATPEEMRDTNMTTLDAMSHGGFVINVQPDTRDFFREETQEPYVSPTLPLE